MSLIVVKDRDQVINKLMALIKKVSDECINKDNCFNIGVSGGSVGSFLAIGLPKIQTDLTKWRIFFCDERVVPEDDSDSTFGFYKTTLLGNVNIKENQFIQIKQGVSAEKAAEDYIEKMTKYFPEGGSWPRFDMLLLGMGPDGHTCSLFPGHKLLDEKSKWVASISDSPKPPPGRITLTFNVINNAKNCVFAISGKEKASMVKKILVDKEDLPSGRVKPSNGELFWILDEAAGQHLEIKDENNF